MTRAPQPLILDQRSAGHEARRPDELPRLWRFLASTLERYAPPVAEALNDCANDLETALLSSANEPLSFDQAATAAGCHKDTIRKLVKAGKLENIGTETRPKVRRGDLPKRSKPATGILDLEADARRLASL